MLIVEIPGQEFFDDGKNEFIKTKAAKLKLEHSLISLSKWESKWKKSFIHGDKTQAEMIDYIRCMNLDTTDIPDYVLQNITVDIVQEISDYIADPMTATTVNNKDGKKNRDIITAEIIYNWMISLNIPFECQKWHLNRLLTLVEVCSIKNAPEKKMGKKEILRQNSSLNAARRAKMHSRG